MNPDIDLLKSAESEFLQRFPGGFQHPEMLLIARKHQLEKRTKQVHDWFSYERFVEDDARDVSEHIIKLVSGSSLISVFEKPKFRDTVRSMSADEKQALASALQARLHGDAQEGFDEMVQLLQPYKIAKWPILTVIPNYFHPTKEAFIKPTTAKGILQYFGVYDFKYSPKPNWDFYRNFRDFILSLRAHTDPSLTASNAAFCGFLMMSIEWAKHENG